MIRDVKASVTKARDEKSRRLKSGRRRTQEQERWSRWGYRALALIIAIGLWYGTAAEKREPQSEKVVEATVTYTTPADTVILNPVNTVRLSVRGNQREIRDLRPFDVEVQVDISDAQVGALPVTLSEENIILPEGSLVVQNINPKVLTLQLDGVEQRRVPIRVPTSGEPAAGAILSKVETNPKTALVSGPGTVLTTVEALDVQEINLDGHALTFEKEVAVVTPNPALRVIQPAVVTVRITLEEPPPPGR